MHHFYGLDVQKDFFVANSIRLLYVVDDFQAQGDGENGTAMQSQI